MLSKLKSYIKPEDDCEITIETTPHAITRDKLEEWQNLGINRISVGVESFLDEELKAMGRDHYRQEAMQGLDLSLPIRSRGSRSRSNVRTSHPNS